MFLNSEAAMKNFRSGSTKSRMFLAGVAWLVVACAAPNYPFTWVDARTESRFGDARTTVEGAEVIMADRAMGPSLMDRLAKRLTQDAGTQLAGRTVRVDRADATLYIHDASASARVIHSNGMDIPIVKTGMGFPERRIRVEYRGSIDGKPFSGSGERSYRVTSGDIETAQAVDDAVNATVASVRAQL
jgi:hypothetical protein